jgi:hypothetical protein
VESPPANGSAASARLKPRRDGDIDNERDEVPKRSAAMAILQLRT